VDLAETFQLDTERRTHLVFNLHGKADSKRWVSE